MTQKPSLCRMVIVDGLQPALNNGATQAPGMITRVWSDTLVNLTVFLDSGAKEHRTSVALHATPEEFAEKVTRTSDGYVAAYWPPRV